MATSVRVSTARFKYNMRPYVNKAKAGEEVIVTCNGRDDFRILPAAPSRTQPLPVGSEWHNPDENERIFRSLKDHNELCERIDSGLVRRAARPMVCIPRRGPRATRPRLAGSGGRLGGGA